MSSITVVEGRDDLVATFDLDEEGNVIVGANLKKFIESMKLDDIIEQPILNRYNSMFGKLIVDEKTVSMYEQAFVDLFIYALALKVKYEGKI
jgi:hypothetical protein